MEIGGVEVGVLSLLQSDENYYVVTVKGADSKFISALNDSEKSRLYICNGWVAATRKAVSLKADIICSSLWRAHLVNIFTMLIGKKIKRVAFIHSTTYAHKVDAFINQIIERTVDMIFCDSRKTHEVVMKRTLTPSVVVPMNITFSHNLEVRSERVLSFVYIGRFTHSQKNLKDALAFIKLLSDLTTESISFTLYGRNDSDLVDVLNHAKELEIDKIVKYCGELNPVEVESTMSLYSFFLQTSLYEGMCITCFQAIKSGLIPIVHPVGEISSYTKDGFNSMHLDLNDMNKSVKNFLEEYQSNCFSDYCIGSIYAEDKYPSFCGSFFYNIKNL